MFNYFNLKSYSNFVLFIVIILACLFSDWLSATYCQLTYSLTVPISIG
jgi:hypothetical protein